MVRKPEKKKEEEVVIDPTLIGQDGKIEILELESKKVVRRYPIDAREMVASTPPSGSFKFRRTVQPKPVESSPVVEDVASVADPNNPKPVEADKASDRKPNR